MKSKTVTLKFFTPEEWEQVSPQPVYFGIPIPKRWVRGYVEAWGNETEPAVVHLQEDAPLHVVAHEVGHVLGHDHHWFPPDLMALHPLRLLWFLPRKGKK